MKGVACFDMIKSGRKHSDKGRQETDFLFGDMPSAACGWAVGGSPLGTLPLPGEKEELRDRIHAEHKGAAIAVVDCIDE